MRINCCNEIVKRCTMQAWLLEKVIPTLFSVLNKVVGAQWLSGRVLDSRPKGSGFEPHRRHCVVVLEQDTFILA